MAGRTEEGDSRDKVALVVFLVAVAAFFVSGYFALVEYRRGISLDPQKLIVEWMESLDQYGRDLLSRMPGGIVPKTDPAQEAEKRLRQVYQLYNRNRLNEALEECGKAIRLDPRNPRAYYWRGRILTRAGEVEPALEAFRAAVNLNPDFREAHDHLGWLYHRKDRLDQALFHLDRSIGLNRENAWAYHQRALVFERKGQMEKALEDAKRACDLKNQDGCKLYEQYRSKGGRT
ncbi:MAG: tetratricopeptide repeat protein [Thermodesulfobacteriota bacterium]